MGRVAAGRGGVRRRSQREERRGRESATMDFAGSNSTQMPSDSQMMHQVKAELDAAYAQEFYNTVRDKCFKACVTSPSSSLGSSERTCLERCVDRYLEATQVVSKSAISALQGGH
mmetsp:Transcript_5945/g.14473  ORF Transcript_5945/g.14473 Transcript_5945/m.14473 type:complete len:115 (-) Transcript_5945:181-525(-)